MFDYDPSTKYDLVAYNDDGNITLPGLIQYTSAPTIIAFDACVDRGELDAVYHEGTQCPVGTTITLRGARFLAAASIVVIFVSDANSNVTLSWNIPSMINGTTIVFTLQPLDDTTAAAVYGQAGSIQVLFTSNNVTTASNVIGDTLYIAPNAPNITAVTSSMCTSVSALQLTACRAMASITITGTNLAPYSQYYEPWLITSLQGGVYQRTNILAAGGNATFSTLTNTTLVFSLPYFDADTNVELQTDVVYTMFMYTVPTHFDSNAFRLSLTYGSVDSTNTPSSGRLSAGAIAGIVVAAVVVSAALIALVAWMVQRRARAGGASHSSKSASEGLSWSLHSSGKQSNDEYKDVELQQC